MVYTCYEMVRDCRAGLPQGWSYFVSQYLPVIRKLTAHYAGENAPPAERILAGLRRPDGQGLFAALEPLPERYFVAALRQKVLPELPAGPKVPAECEIGLDVLAAAFDGLTLVEKQAVWFETMRYGSAETAEMLRMSPHTVEKIRGRASDLLRAQLNSWSRDLLAKNGAALGRTAAGAGTPGCVSSKIFLDIVDGRMSWSGRSQMEQHASGCWHCIDHFCRLLEVAELLRGIRPLSDAEAEPFLRAAGIEVAEPAGWKRWLGG
jgi:hypothetical protein